MNTAKYPYESWVKAGLAEKKNLYYFFFEENITYDMQSRYRTVKSSILYRYFDDLAKNTVDVDIVRNDLNHLEDWIFEMSEALIGYEMYKKKQFA